MSSTFTYKTLASRLTALFNVDGSHLNKYLERRNTILQSLCEDLILNDQIFIPTPDFLTANGLILIIGETNFIELLERNRINFIRTRGLFGYARGKCKDGNLVVFHDPQNRRPQDCPIDESITAGLSVISSQLRNKNKLKQLILKNTHGEETRNILDAVHKESTLDLKQTHFWKNKYKSADDKLLYLPGIKSMEVHVLSAESVPNKSIVDAYLALTLYNSDLYLASKYCCTNVSPFSPIADLLKIKYSRLNVGSDKFWKLMELNGIPDLGIIRDIACIASVLKATESNNAKAFRSWFNNIKHLDNNIILKEYITALREIPIYNQLPIKALRFAITTALGSIPIAGNIASFFDSFILDSLFKQSSPKFFMDDLNKSSGIVGGKLNS